MIDRNALRNAASEAATLVEELPPDVRPALAAEVFRILVGRPLVPEDQVTVSTRPAEDRSAGTLAEFLANRGDVSHPTRLALIAAFRFEHGVDALTTDELRGAYRELRVPMPQNLSLNIGRCMRRGWLVEAPNRDGQKTWRITQSGLRYVRSGREDEE